MAGATSDDEFPIFVCEHNYKVTGVNWIPNASITANGTNYTTMTVYDRGAADAGTTVVASRSYAATSATGLEVDTTFALSATAANLLLSTGDVITVARAHTASGLTLPGGQLELLCQYR